MARVSTGLNRRSFLRLSTAATGGMVLGFSWLTGCKPAGPQAKGLPEAWFDINAYLKIGENGRVTIMSPNPEIGQNVKTSMPMILAEELDCDWADVIVEQAPLNTELFTRQLAGGSQSIRQGWPGLRMAGGTARHLLKEAAAKAWDVPVAEITTSLGILSHAPSGKTGGYGEFASAAAELEVPEEVELKAPGDFKIVGTSRRNVDAKKVVTGQPLFGLDHYQEGMLYAGIVHAPAFGMHLGSFDATEALAMPGIREVFALEAYPEDMTRAWCDETAYKTMVCVVGESTWQVFKAKQKVKAEWVPTPDLAEEIEIWGGRKQTVRRPGGLESSAAQTERMAERATRAGDVQREDGDVAAGFAEAHTVIERSYTAPFLAHNTMEPMNFFADVTDERALLVGPVQTPEFMEKSVARRLGMDLEQIELQMTRMGGGFGRRLYGHFVVEAAAISQRLGKPVQLVYTREDDMTAGTYRPAYHATYKAGLDADGKLVAFSVKGGGLPESPVFADRFPAGAVDNYRAEAWTLETNVTTGAWRAPRSNFIAGAEQAFLDECAEVAGQDPIDFRLALMDKSAAAPVGEDNDYDPERYAGVLRKLKEVTTDPAPGTHRGIAAYYCHNSYVANALDLRMDGDEPVVEKVYAVVDCGIVVNPDAATNMVEGGTIDGIGHALYSQVSFEGGAPAQQNFDRYRLIRHAEAPKEIEVHFIDNGIDPTGLGEPPFPPIVGAVANALYRATGRRHYDQPFVAGREAVG